MLDAGNGPFVAPDVVTLVCRAVLAGGLLDGTQAGESAASSSVAAAMSRALASAKSDICILLSARITDPECTGAGETHSADRCRHCGGWIAHAALRPSALYCMGPVNPFCVTSPPMRQPLRQSDRRLFASRSGSMPPLRRRTHPRQTAGTTSRQLRHRTLPLSSRMNGLARP